MEFVTALRGTFDDQKPSLFELLSEQQLNSLLPPTLRYLLTVATHRYPRYLLRALNSFDELYALAMLVVERHYLRTRGGGFTEHFYGLKREKALQAEIPRAAHGVHPEHCSRGHLGDNPRHRHDNPCHLRGKRRPRRWPCVNLRSLGERGDVAGSRHQTSQRRV